MAKTRKRKTKADAPGAVFSTPGVSGVDPTPGPGHNQPAELTEAERSTLFLRDVAELEDAEDKLASATADLRNVRKRIKADGFTLVQAKAAIAIRKDEDGEAKIRAEIAERLDAARWLGIPWGTQLNIFEHAKPTAIETARTNGKMASIEGRPRRPPHSPETPEYEAWMQGFYDHQEELARGFKPVSGTDPLDPNAPPTNGGGIDPDAPTLADLRPVE